MQHDLAKKASHTTVMRLNCTRSIRVNDCCIQVKHESAALPAATRLKVTCTRVHWPVDTIKQAENLAKVYIIKQAENLAKKYAL